jgi:hypothetical protein
MQPHGNVGRIERVNQRSGAAQADADLIPESRAEWRFAVACSLAFLLVYIVFIARTTFHFDGHLTGTLFDDALISLRYAQNLAMGHGLVWNPGDLPPVEGYTNLGWTLVMSLVSSMVPFRIAPIGVAGVGALVLVASGLIASVVLRRIGSGRSINVGGTLLVLACYPVVFWTLRGMEVGLLSLLLLGSICLALGEDDAGSARTIAWLSVLSGLGLLTRNDSILLFMPVLMLAFWRWGMARHVVPAVAPVGAAALLSVRLFAGVRAFADTLAPVAGAASVIALVACSLTAPRRVRGLCALVFALLLTQWAYLVWVGGDAWVLNYSNRFVATIMPVVLVAAAAAVPHYPRAFWRSMPVAAAFVAVNLLLMIALELMHPREFAPQSYWMIPVGWLGLVAAPLLAGDVRTRDSRARIASCRAVAITALASLFLTSSAHAWASWVPSNAAKVADDVAFAKQGLMLRDRLPEGSVIAAAWLGAPAYFSGLPSVDLLGKTDPHVARLPGTLPFRPGHNKMDLAYSVGELRPDLILIDEPQLRQYGYVRLANGLWLRAGSENALGHAGLADSWCRSPNESMYCPQDHSLYR